MTQRKKRILIAATTLLLAAGSFLLIGYSWYPSRAVSIRIEGTEGTTVRAVFRVDGDERRETLAIPVEKTFQAKEVLFWIQPSEETDDPELKARLVVDGRSFGTCRTLLADRCVRGGVRTASAFRLRREQSFTAEGSAKEADDRWLPLSFRTP